jgi:hypothetical protein
MSRIVLSASLFAILAAAGITAVLAADATGDDESTSRPWYRQLRKTESNSTPPDSRQINTPRRESGRPVGAMMTRVSDTDHPLTTDSPRAEAPSGDELASERIMLAPQVQNAILETETAPQPRRYSSRRGSRIPTPESDVVQVQHLAPATQDNDLSFSGSCFTDETPDNVLRNPEWHRDALRHTFSELLHAGSRAKPREAAPVIAPARIRSHAPERSAIRPELPRQLDPALQLDTAGQPETPGQLDSPGQPDGLGQPILPNQPDLVSQPELESTVDLESTTEVQAEPKLLTQQLDLEPPTSLQLHATQQQERTASEAEKAAAADAADELAEADDDQLHEPAAWPDPPAESAIADQHPEPAHEQQIALENRDHRGFSTIEITDLPAAPHPSEVEEARAIHYWMNRLGFKQRSYSQWMR